MILLAIKTLNVLGVFRSIFCHSYHGHYNQSYLESSQLIWQIATNVMTELINEVDNKG